MRESWTDERLDDMANRMVRDFDRVHADMQGLRVEIGTLRTELREEMRAQGARFDRLESRFDSMQRMTLAAYVSAVVGLVATQL